MLWHHSERQFAAGDYSGLSKVRLKPLFSDANFGYWAMNISQLSHDGALLMNSTCRFTSSFPNFRQVAEHKNVQ